MDKLHIILEAGYWVQVTPISRLNPDKWLAAIYKRGKTGWITQNCKLEFLTPEDAYNWAFEEVFSKINKKEK